jgi:hypothetical protein
VTYPRLVDVLEKRSQAACRETPIALPISAHEILRARMSSAHSPAKALFCSADLRTSVNVRRSSASDISSQTGRDCAATRSDEAESWWKYSRHSKQIIAPRPPASRLLLLPAWPQNEQILPSRLMSMARPPLVRVTA